MAGPALILAESASGARIAASVLLAVYLATAAILLPREMNFLASVSQPQRGKFIAMDVVIQLCVLAVLLPSIILERLTLASLYTIVAGFTVLWIVAAINVRSRYIYTNKILKDSMLETRKQLERLVEEKRAEDGQRD